MAQDKAADRPGDDRTRKERELDAKRSQKQPGQDLRDPQRGDGDGE